MFKYLDIVLYVGVNVDVVIEFRLREADVVIDSFLDGKNSMNETPQLLLLREAYTHSSDGAYTISTTRTYVYVYVNRMRYHNRHTNGCSFKQTVLFFRGMRILMARSSHLVC